MEDNVIFDDTNDMPSLLPEANEAVLLRLGPLFALYRLKIEGKYFLLKTVASDNPRLRQMLRREYELSIGSDHPNIIHVNFFGEVLPGEEGILMDYVEGRTLSEFLAENPSRAERERILTQLLDTVEYLHRRGMIHNDLKPENIIITEHDNTLKLIDFGLSDADAHFLVKTPGYSPLYAAPELQNERRSDVRSDVYSVGKIMADILGSRYDRIVRKCTETLPGDRYQSVSDLKKAFRQRGMLPWIAAGVAALLLLAAGITWLATSQNDKPQTTFTATVPTITKTLDTVDTLQLELDSLKISYMLLVDSLKLLNANYKALRDSVDNASSNNERHRLAVEQRIAEFQTEIDARMQKALQTLKTYRTTAEAASFISMFSDDMENFYRGYPKMVDDEDITQAIHTAYQTAMSRTEEFIKVMSTLPN